jgi:hypothetical protein
MTLIEESLLRVNDALNFMDARDYGSVYMELKPLRDKLQKAIDDANYERIEREHLGDAEKLTGIYAPGRSEEK